MPEEHEESSDQANVAVAEPEQQQQTAQKNKTKKLPPYAVILHNDDLNTFDFVMSVIRTIFNYELVKTRKLVMEAHLQGRSQIWTGHLEMAELKADQIRSCGPDPTMKARGALTLKVTVEPLPQ